MRRSHAANAASGASTSPVATPKCRSAMSLASDSTSRASASASHGVAGRRASASATSARRRGLSGSSSQSIPARSRSRYTLSAAPAPRRPPARAACADRSDCHPRRGTPRARWPARRPSARERSRPYPACSLRSASCTATAFGSCSFSGSRTSVSRRPGANASSCRSAARYEAPASLTTRIRGSSHFIASPVAASRSQ